MDNSIEMNDDELSALRKDTIAFSISERREKILRAVIVWYTRNDRPKDRERLLEWFWNGNINEATEYQLKIKRELQEFLPALFESHDDNSMFVDKNDRTPLHCCISKMGKFREDYIANIANFELVCALCHLGASIVAVDCDGRSPLGIALDNGRINLLMNVLIHSDGINVADRNKLGQTALHILIDKYDYVNGGFYGTYEYFVKALLRKGADSNQPDRDGVTPVHLAAKKLDIELLRTFKENRADLNRRTNCGDDLLIFICKSLTTSREDHEKALKLIDWLVFFQRYRANVKNNNGFTALHYAAKSGNIDLTRAVMKAGVDVHAVANDDTNALHSAAGSTDFEFMQQLIKQNVDCHRRDNVYGFSLLHMAAFSSEPRICEWLVKEKGFDVDDLGKFQLTPIHLASMLGNAGAVKKLIELGADVHRTDDKLHYSALHLASMRGRFATIRDIKANDHKEIRDDQSSLIDHCFNHHRLLDQYVDYGATLVALLGADADVNARDNHGCTALHYATRESVADDIVLVLLKAGAHVDVQDNKCLTPLENCFVSNNHKGLRNLLTFGANINDIAPSIAHLMDEIFRKATHYYDSAAGPIMEHLLKMKIAGLLIDESYKRLIDNFGSDYLKRQSNYSSELTEMKKRILTDDVSLYDVLHMNFKRISTFANSLPRDIERKFRNYFVVLKGRCNEAVNRMALFEPAREAFKWMTGMPDICIDIIMSFMSNRSLRVLIDAASVTEL